MRSLTSPKLVFYQYLLSIFPILSLYTNNIDITNLRDILPSFFHSIVLTYVTFMIINKIINNINTSALIVSCFLFSFFSYGHLFGLIRSLNYISFSQTSFFLIFISITLTASYLLIKNIGEYLDGLTNTLNIFIGI